MEDWEIEFRDKLNLELEDGYYQISNGENGFVMGTGKQGYINFLVEMKRQVMNLVKDWGPGIENQIKDIDSNPKKEYTSLTEQDVIDLMEDLRNKDNKNV